MSLLSALLFPAPEPSYTMHSFPGELLWIPHDLDYAACKPGDCAPAVFLQCPNARYLVLYLHSNGEDAGLCYNFGAGMRLVLEVHVLLVEYPGYGLCPGKSSEESLWRTVEAAYRFVDEVLHWPTEDLIVMGRSLGTALAVRLARKRTCHGLILVAPFLSLADAVGQYVGGSLARAIIGRAFSSAECMEGIEVPTLVIHGQEDHLIPCSQGRRLLELCPHDRKVFVSPEGLGHNSDLLADPSFLIRPLLGFFALPDYNFEDLRVPPEAFDKRLCLQYHNIVELAKGDTPLRELRGDQEPCPCYCQCDSLGGPHSQFQIFQGGSGDVDDLSGFMDAAVQGHRGGRVVLPGEVVLEDDGEADSDTAAGAAAFPASESLASASTTAACSSRPTRHSDSPPSGDAAPLGDAESGGLSFLDIDTGISRFLRESSSSPPSPARVAREAL